MSRATQISDRKRIEAFFRELFRDETGLDGRAAGTLAERCARRIKRVVVWDDVRADGTGDMDATGSVTAAAQGTAAPAATAEIKAPPPIPATRPAVPAVAPAPAAAPAAAAAAAFDPYAFSAVVVLTKTGKDGLLKRLATIDRVEHLKKLAEAQHLAVDAALSSAAELRAAIVKAAEQRIANRRAAAS